MINSILTSTIEGVRTQSSSQFSIQDELVLLGSNNINDNLILHVLLFIVCKANPKSIHKEKFLLLATFFYGGHVWSARYCIQCLDEYSAYFLPINIFTTYNKMI